LPFEKTLLFVKSASSPERVTAQPELIRLKPLIIVVISPLPTIVDLLDPLIVATSESFPIFVPLPAGKIWI
jgi:hypothetical protein